MNSNHGSKQLPNGVTDGQHSHLGWQSAHDWPRPKRIESLNTSLGAEPALRLVSQGVGLLWQGDFFEGRRLLQTIKRRLTDKTRKTNVALRSLPWPQRFHRVRMQRAQVARQLGLVIIEVSPDYRLGQRRAPDARAALQMAYGAERQNTGFLMPLTELVGVLSAYEWHRTGLDVAPLQARIYPRWGVFAPTRHEYLDLVMQAELPNPCRTAVDVGTGTGVLAMLLAKRGVASVLATDTNPAAVACATDNVTRLGFSPCIDVVCGDLIPTGQYDLLVCNPPWLPGAASGSLEAAVYDPDHQMLKGFLQAASQHLNPGGQAWLILSDLAEHLRLRDRPTLLDWIAQSGLKVLGRIDTKPTHNKRLDPSDPLLEARQAEVTSLWQLSSSDETP